MDSQRLQDHLRDEADSRNNTTLGCYLDDAAERIDELEDEVEALKRDLALVRDQAARDRKAG